MTTNHIWKLKREQSSPPWKSMFKAFITKILEYYDIIKMHCKGFGLEDRDISQNHSVDNS